ncbi:hypothetical protein C0991_002381 [Blastosporella zonata]|nr:hypothetical protein C0991_002381 [Blastosporella zonata]
MSSDSDTVQLSATPPAAAKEKPFCRHFFAPCNAVERRIYLITLVKGCFLIVVTIFAVFPIYWGSLWKTPVRPLNGWVVDFDGGPIGQFVAAQLVATSPATKVTLMGVPASHFPGGPNDLINDVVEQHTWVAVAINPGASARLQASYVNPNATYNGTEAITMYAAEARNENAL